MDKASKIKNRVINIKIIILSCILIFLISLISAINRSGLDSIHVGGGMMPISPLSGVISVFMLLVSLQMLNIDNKKMSKSLGNFFTVRDITEKYDPMVLRFFMLSAHYRSQLNFSADLMEAAKNSLERIKNSESRMIELIKNAKDGSMTAEEEKNLSVAKEFMKKYEAAMEDDFNTADAISAMFELVKFMNTSAASENSKEYLEALNKELLTMADILGIKLTVEEEILDSEIEQLIEKRQNARKNKDFALADEIRNTLLEKGILLEDTREGVKWKRV